MNKEKHWNYSETDQAIARGYRIGSHNELIKNKETPVLNIIQAVSIPRKKGLLSIDLHMYKMSEDKDISIKNIMRLLMESAVDCSLNYNRNYVEGHDNQRYCEYTKCSYKCDGIDMKDIDNLDDKNLDFSTYQLYYSNTQDIIKHIMFLFQTKFKLEIKTILKKVNKTKFEILTVLNEMINKNIPITNKYGIVSYLREKDNIYYLTNDIEIDDHYLSYYTQYPTVSYKKTFTELLENIQEKYLPNLIDSLCNVQNKDDFKSMIDNIPKKVQEMFIEASISSKQQQLDDNTVFRNIILDYYKPYIKIDTNLAISTYLEDISGTVRCLKNNKWSECSRTNEDVKKILDKESEVEASISENPYGFYGIINPQTDIFKIFNKKEEKIKLAKGREKEKVKLRKKYPKLNDKELEEKIDLMKTGSKKYRGQNCSTWKKEELLMVVHAISLPSLSEEKLKDKKDKLKKLKEKNKKESGHEKELKKFEKYGKYKFNKKLSEKDFGKLKEKLLSKNFDINILNDDELERVLFWNSQYIPVICKAIYNFFKDKNLIVEHIEKSKEKVQKYKKGLWVKIPPIVPKDTPNFNTLWIKGKKLKPVGSLIKECTGETKDKLNLVEKSKEWTLIFNNRTLVGFMTAKDNMISDICITDISRKKKTDKPKIANVALSGIIKKNKIPTIILNKDDELFDRHFKSYTSYGFTKVKENENNITLIFRS